MKRLTIDNIKSFAKEKGWALVSKEYKNNKTKLDWLCKNGHEISMSLSDAKRNGCPKCSKSYITLDYVASVVKEKGWKLLSTKYINNRTKLDFECGIGHEFSMPFQSVKKHNCPVCSGRRRYTIEDANIFAKDHDMALLSLEFENSDSLLDWLCLRCGNSFSYRFNEIKKFNCCCPICDKRKHVCFESRKKVRSFDEFKNNVEVCNFKLLTNEKDYYENSSKDKVLVKCNLCDKETYIHRGTINKKNLKCRECFDEKRRIDMNVIRALVENKNGILLSLKYKNNNEKLKILCNDCNTIFEMSYSNLRAGKWCKKCALSKLKNSEEYVRKVIDSHGGILLSEYKNNKTHLKVLCKACNNIFYIKFTSILSGDWCAKCSTPKQTRLYEIIKNIYTDCNVEFNYNKFAWLKNKKTGGTQSIDIFVFNKEKNFSLAIEYDGEQHFVPVQYFGGERAFKYIKKLDKRKNRLIKKHTNDINYFVRFNYKDKILNENVVKKLIENNIPLGGNIK